MSSTKQTKSVKLTEQAHENLMEAKLTLYGPSSMHEASFSDVILALTEQQLSGSIDNE